MKSFGNRSRLRLTAWTSARVLTPYSAARSASNNTRIPRTITIACSMRRALTSVVLRMMPLPAISSAEWLSPDERGCAFRAIWRDDRVGEWPPPGQLPAHELLDALAVADFRGVDVALRVGGDVVEEDELAGVVADAAEAADLFQRAAVEDVHAAIAGVGQEEQFLLRIW